MSEDKVQAKIEADVSDFQDALKDALTSLTHMIGEMKSGFSVMAETVKTSMKETSDASSAAAKNIADEMKESATQTTQAIGGISQALKRLRPEVENAGSVESFVGSLKEAMQSASALAASIFILNTAFDLFKSGIAFNAQMEQATISFETMLGSTDKAKTMIDGLQKMAASTPFEFPDLQDGAKRMLAFGFSAEEVIPMLTAVGDAAAGLGMSGSEGINRIVVALGQMKAKGKVSGEEMMQMTEAGIPAWDILAKSIGVTTGEVMKMGEQGVIPADKAIQALVAGMAERFPNMMEKQSKSFVGMMSTIRDNFNAVVGDLVKPGFEELSEIVLPNIIQTLEKFAKTLKEFGAVAAFKSILPPQLVEATIMACQMIGAGLSLIRENASGLSAVIVGVTTALTTYRGIALGMIVVQAAQTAALVATVVAAWGLKSAFIGVALAMNINPVILAVTLAMGALAACVYYVSDNWTAFKGWCIGFWNDVVDFIADNIGLIIALFPGLAAIIFFVYENWDAGVQLIGELWNTLTGFLTDVVDVIKKIIDSVGEAWPKFVDGAQEGVGKFAEALASLAGDFIPDWAKSIWDQIVGLGSSLAAKTAEIGNAIRKNLKISGGGDTASVGDFRRNEYENEPKKPEMLKFDPVEWSGITMPTGGSKGGSGAAGRSSSVETSEYEQAKKLYDQQLRLAEYTSTEKEALYKKFLENVQKSEKEAMDYKVGLYQLDKGAFAEMLKVQEIELQNSKTQGKITELEYTTELAAMKKKNLDAETDFRAKAMMEAEKLTEAEKAVQIGAYKEKVEATIWYKEALKDILIADKSLADSQKNVARNLADFRKQLDLDAISSEEKRLEIQRSQDIITQEQLIQSKKDLEDLRYAIEKAALEKSLEENAKNIDEMKKSYEKYVNVRDIATKEMIAKEMVLNGLSADKVKAILEQLEKLYGLYTNKQLDLDNELRKERIKNLEQIRDSMKDTMSEAFQSVLTKSMSFLEALKNVFSSTMKSILKQFTDTIAKTITDKAFKKFTKNGNSDDKIIKEGKNDKKNRGKEVIDKARVIVAEQAKQAQLTAIAMQGNTKRAAIKAASSEQEIALTTTTTATETTLHTTADQTISASAQMAGQTAVQSIQASLEAMISMLPTLLIMSALSSLFGGGGSKTTESTGPGINLGRNPDSYYETPSLAGIPSLDVGSWQLPADTLAMVHKNEMIVPAKGGLADGVRNMLTNGRGQSGGSSPTFNLSYSAAHYGRTNKDVQAEMRQNAKFMVKTLNSEYRNFNRGKAK